MSWLKQLANKAEAALEKLDSETAAVLKKEKVNYKPVVETSYEHKRSSSFNLLNNISLSSVNHESHPLSFSAQNSLNSSPKDLKSRKKNLNQLCNNGATNSNKRQSQNNLCKNETLHSRQSSSSSFTSSYVADSERESSGHSAVDIDTSMDSGHIGSVETTCSSLSVNYLDSHNTLDSFNGTPSSFNECEMLRKEVFSLNQEMQQVLRRAKEAECDTERIRSELSILRSQQKQNEVLLKQSKKKETYLQDKLRDIETNTQSFQSRLSDEDISCKLSNDQNQRLLTGSSKENNITPIDLKAVTERCEEITVCLKREKDSSNKLREQCAARIRTLEENKKVAEEELSIYHQRLESLGQTNITNSRQMAGLKAELTDCRQEFEDYKKKAARILEAKEKLFESFRLTNDEGGNINSETLFRDEITQLNNERDFLREELNRSEKIINSLRTDMIEVELSSKNELDTVVDRLSLMENDFTHTRDEMMLTKEQKTRAEHELAIIQDDAVKIKNTLAKRLEDRDKEIDKLQKQIAHKISSSIGSSELEHRIHSLTETLILKQNNLESISAEKHALTLQCEKLQEQYTEAQRMLNTDVKINFEDDRNRQLYFMTESPFDGGVARGVKKFYGCLDKYSVRLFTFLRRHPTARLCILIYILLHFWVLIVLFKYTPESHT